MPIVLIIDRCYTQDFPGLKIKGPKRPEKPPKKQVYPLDSQNERV